MAAAPRTVPVPENLITGPRVFACQVRGYSMTGDGILDGDMVLIDPDQHPGDGDIAVVTITWKGIRGKVLKRLRQGGYVLESSNPRFPPMRLGPENNPLGHGRVIAVIRDLE